MSYRMPPPPPAINTRFPPRFSNKLINESTNSNFAQKPRDNYQANVSSNFSNYNTRNSLNINNNVPLTTTESIPTMFNANNLIPGALPPNQFYNAQNSGLPAENSRLNARSQSRVPFPYQSSLNNLPDEIQNSGSAYSNIGVPYNQYFPNPVQQNAQTHFMIPSPQNFPYPSQNVENFNQKPMSSYNTPISNVSMYNSAQNSMAENVHNYNISSSTFSVIPPAINNNQSSLTMNNQSFPRMPQVLSNISQALPPMNDSFFFNVPPPTLQTISPINFSENIISEKEQKLAIFLQKYTFFKKKNEKRLTVPEYRSKLIAAFSILNLLTVSKSKLSSLLEASKEEWNLEMEYIVYLKKQLSDLCTFISSESNLSIISKKLKYIKKKRNQKKKTKLNKLSEKIKVEQRRKELNQQIDKWLDDLKEKNLKLKREVEMKKEADFILLEVRRKIHEANRTIEKIKVLEKLRNIRQTNAIQKGLHVQPEHDENFQKKMSHLKEIMLRQLADYTAEEKALKVMLETEQEGQREEIIQWEIKKIKTIQLKRQKHITECLFGNSEDPLPTDPLYLFHKFHTSANNSVDNLIQIRHQWDMHLSEDGDTVPEQWVVPSAPSSSQWEKCLISSRS